MRRIAGLDWRIAALFAFCLVLAAMAVTRSARSALENQGPRVQSEDKADGALQHQKPAQSVRQAPGGDTTLTQEVVPGAPGGKAEHNAEQRNEEGTETLPVILGYRLKITDALLVVLTAFLAIYTRALNRSTVKLWEAGERQIEVSRQSLASAQKTLSLSEETAGKQLRAYVGIERVSLDGTDPGFAVKATIVIKNFGQTPAFDERISLVMGAAPEGIEDIEVAETMDNSNPATVMPGSTIETRMPRRSSDPMVLSHILRTGGILWLVGKITYTDAFGGARVSNVRMYAPRDSRHFVCAQTGNDAT